MSDFVAWVNARDVEDLTRPKNKLIQEEGTPTWKRPSSREDTRLEAKHNDFRLLMKSTTTASCCLS